MRPNLVIERVGDISVIRLLGAHDMVTAPVLHDVLEGALADASGVVVDLTAAEFIDSTILGVLVGARSEAIAARKIIVIQLGAADAVHRVFHLPGYGRFFPVGLSQSEAVELATLRP